MSESRERLGFIGLGLMGRPMARRLLGAGRAVAVWNRSPDKAAALRAAGAETAASAAELAGTADIVFTCVTDTAAMEAVVFGPDGIAEADGRGKVLVDHSSIHPEATRAFAERLGAANGMSWIDAPVSGGVAGAEAGTLAIMAGGSAESFARVRPYLDHLCARATLLGAVGAGQTAKLCNQMIVGCGLAVIAESLSLATKAGIDAGALIPAVAGGFADSKPLQIFGPRMLAGVETPIGHLEIVLKDLETALDVGGKAQAPMPMTGAAGALYRHLVARGQGKREFDALYRHFRDGEPSETP